MAQKRVSILLVVLLTCLLVLTASACVPDSRITMAEFEAIEEGMPYEEVVEIIGSEGEELPELGDEEEKTTFYTWTGAGEPGANANILFKEDKVFTKSQFGLK